MSDRGRQGKGEGAKEWDDSEGARGENRYKMLQAPTGWKRQMCDSVYLPDLEINYLLQITCCNLYSTLLKSNFILISLHESGKQLITYTTGEESRQRYECKMGNNEYLRFRDKWRKHIIIYNEDLRMCLMV